MEANSGALEERMARARQKMNDELQAVSSFVRHWNEFLDEYKAIDASVVARHQELALKEQTMEIKSKTMEAALDQREKAVAEREEALLEKERQFREVSMSKQQEPLKQDGEGTSGTTIQEYRDHDHDREHDHENHERYEPQEVEPSPASQSMELDLNLQPSSDDSPLGDDEYIPLMSEPPKRLGNGNVNAGVNGNRNGGAPVGSGNTITVRPELKALCQSMDGHGLRKFVVEHKREGFGLRQEMPLALQHAQEPPLIVMEALEAYHPELFAASSFLPRRDPELSANRRACIFILECLQVALADPDLGVDHPMVPPSVKEIARNLADKWKSRIDVRRDRDGSSMDAQAFLQLVATFGIAAYYDEEELCKLVCAVSGRKHMPALCRALGLSAKMPDVVSKLIEERKHLDALTFASEFGIMNRFDPVTLLKEYLEEAERVAQGTAKKNEAIIKALRTVIRYIEQHHLESDFPTAPLHRRISGLEKARNERKRSAGPVRGQPKRPRNNGGYRNSNHDHRSHHYGTAPAVTTTTTGNGSTYPFQPTVFDRQSQYIQPYVHPNNGGNGVPGAFLFAPDGSIYGGAPSGTGFPAAAYGTSVRKPPPPPAYQHQQRTPFMH